MLYLMLTKQRLSSGMHQGNILNLGMVAPMLSGQVDEAGLRELDWSELVCRLAAARDLRRLVNTGEARLSASFDRSSAVHLAALRIGKRAINPIALANGKAAAGNSLPTSLDTACDRGTQ